MDKVSFDDLKDVMAELKSCQDAYKAVQEAKKELKKK